MNNKIKCLMILMLVLGLLSVYQEGAQAQSKVIKKTVKKVVKPVIAPVAPPAAPATTEVMPEVPPPPTFEAAAPKVSCF